MKSTAAFTPGRAARDESDAKSVQTEQFWRNHSGSMNGVLPAFLLMFLYMFASAWMYKGCGRCMVFDVRPTAEARRDLAKYLRAFREAPVSADPIVLGPHRRAEAVLLPIEQYRALLDRIEELSVRAEVGDVLRSDTGCRGDLASLAREHGFDPAEFGLS